ncbi:MAG TPA: TetR/AcrR family transcriptional regulator [Gaiellaceae bacterium]|nr:TetR/AcrR family transcriptional regulator [Gaiellaceae bacterium]
MIDNSHNAYESPSASTEERILDIAQRLIQERGYNKFSYSDIATELAITKPAIHYHFPSKVDLGCAIVRRYRQRTQERLIGISRDFRTLEERLQQYVDLFLDLLRNEFLMCPGGMLAVELMGLPVELQDEVRGFFEDHEAWLEGVIAAGGVDVGAEPSLTTKLMAKAGADARAIVAALEGAVMMARLYEDEGRFHEAAARVIRFPDQPPTVPVAGSRAG